jgi:hypothetical protein
MRVVGKRWPVLAIVVSQGFACESSPSQRSSVPLQRSIWVEAEFQPKSLQLGIWVDKSGAYCIATGKKTAPEKLETCMSVASCVEAARRQPWRLGSLTSDERTTLERLSAPTNYEQFRANDFYRDGRGGLPAHGARVMMTVYPPLAKDDSRDPTRFYPVGSNFIGVLVEGAANNKAATIELLSFLRGVEERHQHGRWCRPAP